MTEGQGWCGHAPLASALDQPPWAPRQGCGAGAVLRFSSPRHGRRSRREARGAASAQLDRKRRTGEGL